MAWKIFTVRLDEDIHKEVAEAAAKFEISSSAMARIFIRDGLAQFDRKHEALLKRTLLLEEKVDSLRKSVDQSNMLTSMSVAAVSFLDVGRIDGKTESGQDRVKANIQSSTKMGSVIKELSEHGLLNKDV